MRDEKDLENLISKLAANKSETTPDSGFDKALNFKLHSEISKLSNQKQINPIIKFNFMKKFGFAAASLVAVAMVTLIVVTLPKQQGTILPGKQQITKVSDKAFGSLATLTSVSGKGGGGGDADAPESANLSAPSSTMASPAIGMGGGGVSDSKLIYRPVNYNFVYKGDAFTIDSDKMPVYEREKGFGSSLNLDSILNNFNVGMFNIGKFSNARLDYITASQDFDQGYMLSMDFREGTVNIGQNWEKWVTPMSMCVDQSCYDANRLKIDQVPSDESIINTVNQFLADYGIDSSAFGTPYIQDNWRVLYAQASDKLSVYIPDMISVIYPTKIAGNEIYDQSGNKTGMYASVDVRTNKVTGIGELNGQRYQSSDYETEQDTTTILKLAQSGGYQSYYPLAEDSGVDTQEVELGNPVSGYMRLWLTLNNQSKDVYVPSLIFPIINAPKDMYSKNVAVPIIKDVLNQGGRTYPPIMPMDKAVM